MNRSGLEYGAEFARLVPSNKAAIIAFDQVASKLKSNPDWNLHARKYMAIHADKREIFCAGSESESENGSGHKMQGRRIWSGYYRLHFDIPPRDPRLGWVLGGGKFAAGDECPELVLTERKLHDSVSGRHAQLYHNYSSGAMVLKTADQTLTIADGKRVHDSIAIWSSMTRLTVGCLAYDFYLDDAVDDIHQPRLIRYQQRHGLTVENYPLSLSATPAESDYVLKDYIIKNPVGRGRFSTVFAGEDLKTGRAVAIKRITRDHQNTGLIQQEMQMAQTLGRHHRLCQLVDVMSPQGDRRSAHFRDCSLDDVYLVYSPLAVTTWLAFCEPRFIGDIHHYVCTELFGQCLEGIEYIHSKGIVHRDIQPANLAIVSLHPPECRVIDFGSARRGTAFDDTDVGSSLYRAPEMCRILSEGGKSGLVFDAKVDIFALGVSAYQFFCKTMAWWSREPNAHDLNAMKDDLRLQPTAPLEIKTLITSMLADDATLRPSAVDARRVLR